MLEVCRVNIGHWDNSAEYEDSVFIVGQPNPNTLVDEAMTDKVDMMVGLGAMFIQPGSAVKTATQAEGDQRVQHSVLSLIASSCGETYSECLGWVAQFMGAAGSVEFAVSQDVVARDTEMMQQVMNVFVTRAMPIGDYLRWMQRFNLVSLEKTLEQFREEVDGGSLYADFEAPRN